MSAAPPSPEPHLLNCGSTVAHAVVDALGREGVERVFGIPGTHNLEIYRHLSRSRITHTVFRHEQGATFAADAYARRSGRPGVVVTTSGPGVLNALSAVANSYADAVPVLVLCPSIAVGHEQEDLGWIHEVKNQLQALDAVAERAVRCSNAERVSTEIHDAFARWRVERTRPVILEIPLDVLEGPAVQGQDRALSRPVPPSPDAATAREIARRVAESSRPLVIAGGGTIGARDALRDFAELADAPVFTTQRAKGVLPETHPLAAGTEFYTDAGRHLVDSSDLVIALGTKFGQTELRDRPLTPPGFTVRVDLHAGRLSQRFRADRAVISDTTAFLDAVNAELRPASKGGPRRTAAVRAEIRGELDRKTAPWQPLHDALRSALPAEAVIVGDSSQVTYRGTVHLWPAVEPNQVISPVTFATLGYALPGAIGAKLADRSRSVVCLMGDGAAMFSIQELVTAAELRLALPVIVVDNGGYFEIKEEMVGRGIAPLAVDLLNPDFVALAKAMGCEGESVGTDLQALGRSVQRALARDVPTLIHVVAGT
ncbi:thiamine pyrophosphate-binding protein [Acrocarpospora catenulata]|uniref:thiamine pyrophosphate-binding protein n=1 Tax=Acrocarpospora catenulata TaxID=2836182 RepID=UPI001BDA09A9|nr:thiamine pyrophosphate-binding protein [Acrocarpospora catenulata]